MSGPLTRRGSLGCLAGLTMAGRAQDLAGEPPGRIAPLKELVNVFEVLAMARRKLPENVYSRIAGSDRRFFERITFRPRLMVNVAKLDLSTELLGERLFTPIIVGPVGRQADFHPDGEVAMARGASAGKALMVVSKGSSRALPEIAGAAKTTLWYQVYPESDLKASIRSVEEAVAAGCKAVCVTLGVPGDAERAPKWDWPALDQVRRAAKVPLVLKGVMSAEEAAAAAEHGAAALVVSNHGGMLGQGYAEPMSVLAEITGTVGAKTPVLIDGSFRRGTDILKALALGARAVMVSRPALWGLAAYGAEGVQTVVEMLQTELARNMVLCGKADVRSIDRSIIRVHKR